MASRLPTPAHRLLARRTPLHLLPSLSQSPLPPATPLIQARLPQPQPTTTTTTATTITTTTRQLSTTSSRPWLLSALPNLAASATGGPPPPKTIHARRLLPYPAAQIYTLIADIDSYTHFLPHCPHSRVTKWVTTPTPTPTATATATGNTTTGSSPPPPELQPQPQPGTRHPALADLTVGWGPFTQTYTSRVYCVPGSVVEAVSGSRAATSIPADVLRSVGYPSPSSSPKGGEGEKMEGIFESLVTRWTVKPVARPTTTAIAGGGEWSEVVLSVTFQFANPALGFAVGQLADEKADEMVEAFEGRARKLYGGGR